MIEIVQTCFAIIINNGLKYTKRMRYERQTTLDFHHQLKGAILEAVDEGLLERDPTRKAIIKGKTPKVKLGLVYFAGSENWNVKITTKVIVYKLIKLDFFKLILIVKSQFRQIQIIDYFFSSLNSFIILYS